MFFVALRNKKNYPLSSCIPLDWSAGLVCENIEKTWLAGSNTVLTRISALKCGACPRAAHFGSEIFFGFLTAKYPITMKQGIKVCG